VECQGLSFASCHKCITFNNNSDFTFIKSVFVFHDCHSKIILVEEIDDMTFLLLGRWKSVPTMCLQK